METEDSQFIENDFYDGHNQSIMPLFWKIKSREFFLNKMTGQILESRKKCPVWVFSQHYHTQRKLISRLKSLVSDGSVTADVETHGAKIRGDCCAMCSDLLLSDDNDIWNRRCTPPSPPRPPPLTAREDLWLLPRYMLMLAPSSN